MTLEQGEIRLPIHHPVQQLKGRERAWWNKEETVDYFRCKPADPRIERRVGQIMDKEAKMALDLGCGGGRHIDILLSMGFDAYGCDINPAMVKMSRTITSRHVGPDEAKRRVIPGTILAIPFETSTFDVVVTTGVLHQAKSEDEYEIAVAELARVTRKDGVVCLNIFTNAAWDPTYTRIPDTKYAVTTQEGLDMTLLPKETFYDMMAKNGLLLEEELAEEIRAENTGDRAVLRSHFIKL